MNTPLTSMATLMFAIALGASPMCAWATPDDEAKIKELESRFVAAVKAKDVDAIMKVYVPDESLFVFDVIPPRQYVGAKAYAKDWTDLFSMLKGPVNFEISDLSVTTDGTMGFGHSIQRVTGSDTKGQPIDLTAISTAIG